MAYVYSPVKPAEISFDEQVPGKNGGYIKMAEVQAQPPLAREKLSYHQAARYGNAVVVQKYLQSFRGKKKRINKLNKQELSALHYAVRYGHINVIKLLVAAKANIKVQGADGAQPIHFAARYFKSQKHVAGSTTNLDQVQDDIAKQENFIKVINEEEPTNRSPLNSLVTSLDPSSNSVNVISFLLKHGADVNAVDNYNQTPLNYASVKGNIEALAMLLKWPGINIEIPDTSGGTALHNACGNGHTEVAKLLLLSGALLMVWDNERMNPLHYAATGDGSTILKEIIEDIESQGGQMGNWSLRDILNDQDNQGQSLLHLAVDVGCYSTCCLLIDKGANVNLCRSGFVTPLHLAAVTGNLDIVKLLISSNADIEAENISNETPLHKAAVFNRHEVMEYLLSKGCCKDVVDHDNSTPIVIASSNGNLEAVKILLNANADLSIVDSSEKSALFWAAEENAMEVMELLLDPTIHHDFGDMNLLECCDRFENTPLHIAAKKGFKRIVELLLNYGAIENPCNDEELTPLHLAAINGNKKVITALLHAKPSIINDEDESGNTALHLAALNGHPKIIDILIDYGASVDPRNSLLWTPLDCAAGRGHVKCVIELLERDSPIDPMDLAYTTPLHLASREGHQEVVKILLEQGADTTLLDNTGKNALDMAIEKSHRNVVLTLAEHKDWLCLFKNRTLSSSGTHVTTPLRQLIIKMPDIAYLVMNQCMKLSSHIPQDHPDFKVQFFYDLLDDTYLDWSVDNEDDDVKSMNSKSSKDSLVTTTTTGYEDANKLTPKIIKLLEKKENHPLSIMCEYKRGNLLNHPLVLSLIYQKWGQFGRIVFYAKFFLYFLFLFFLTGYVLVAIPLHPHPVSHTDSTCVPRATVADRDKVLVWIFVRIGRIVVLFLGALQLIFELGQLLARRLTYVIDITNWMEWLIYCLAMIFVWPDIDDYITANIELQRNGCDSVNISIGCCAIFLAWIDLLLFTQKFPSLGIYVVMFNDVLKTFLKFSLTFSLFVIAFALGFYTLLYDGDQMLSHGNIGRTLLKTLVMMIGEFDFDSLFNDGSLHPPLLTWFLFFLFVIIMTILLMNLLVGLAVDDIKGVLDQAVLNRVAMQVNLVLDVQKTLPRSFRKKYIVHETNVYPNKEFKWYKLKAHVTRMKAIEEALHPEKSVSDVVQEHTESISVSVVKLKKDFKEMNRQMKNIEEMVETLLKHSNLTNESDDYLN